MGKIYRDDRAISSDLKKEVCPYCKNDLGWMDVEVCDTCHHHVVNRCTICDHKNPNNARYCELCGAETFFLKEKLLFAFDTHLSPEEIKRLKKSRREIYHGRDNRRSDEYVHAGGFSHGHKNPLEVENPMVLDWLWHDGNKK